MSTSRASNSENICLKPAPKVLQLELENVEITVVLPRAASRCAQTRSSSHTRSHLLPARWLALSRTRHSIELAHTHKHLLALARSFLHSLAFAGPPVGSHSLYLAKTR